MMKQFSSLCALRLFASIFLGVAGFGNLPSLSAESAPAARIQSPSVLTDAQKNEIRAEERFRHETEKEIVTEEGKDTSWWSVLNSSFALWFLSSVVVSGLTAAVALYQKRHSAQKQRINLQTRLTTEISYRINNSLVAIRLDVKRVNAGNLYAQGWIYDEALSYLNNRVYSEKQLLDFSIHQDYKTRRFLSLVFELRSTVGAALLPALREAQNAYAAIEALADDAAIENPVQDKAGTLRAIGQSIEQLERLRDNEGWKNLS